MRQWILNIIILPKQLYDCTRLPTVVRLHKIADSCAIAQSCRSITILKSCTAAATGLEWDLSLNWSGALSLLNLSEIFYDFVCNFFRIRLAWWEEVGEGLRRWRLHRPKISRGWGERWRWRGRIGGGEASHFSPLNLPGCSVSVSDN